MSLLSDPSLTGCHTSAMSADRCVHYRLLSSSGTLSQLLVRYVLLLLVLCTLVRCPLPLRHFSMRQRTISHVRNQSKLFASEGVYYDSLPSSFAILINLGLDGQFHNLYSSHSHSDLCDSQQVWDPFNRQCRQLFCKNDFEIQNLKCVHGNASYTKTKPAIKFVDSSSQIVNVTYGFSTTEKTTDLNEQWIASNQLKIISQFSQQFSDIWLIDSNRLINISVQAASGPIVMNITFLIMENKALPNQDILAMDANDHIENKKFHYIFMGHMMTIKQIHSSMPEMEGFCVDEMPIWYWNSDFTILSKDNLTMIYVNKTGRLYYPGEYMGSVLCVEYVDPQGHIRLNVSSNSVVCEQALPDESCPRIKLNHSEYEFVDGRSLYSRNGHYYDKFELTDNQSVYVCLPPSKTAPVRPTSLDDQIESYLSTSLMLISITLLSLVLVTFVRIRTLRSSINGFNSINLVVCLEIMQITFLLNQFIHQCRVSAVMFHFFILATISWSSVIAYDMHQVFVRDTLIARANSNKVRLLYGTVAYFLPALIVTVANVGDIFDLSAIKGDYGPVLQSNVCWMRKREAKITYFIVPVALTVLCNFVLYLRIICNIRSEIKSFSSLKKVTRIPSSSSSSSTISVISSSESSESKLAFNQTSIYTRLSVPLGFTWIIALFSTVVPPEYRLLIRIMSYLFIVANTSQGVTLFLAFGVYKKLFSSK